MRLVTRKDVILIAVLQKAVPPARFERTAPGLGILCSILLSYGGTWPAGEESYQQGELSHKPGKEFLSGSDSSATSCGSNPD